MSDGENSDFEGVEGRKSSPGKGLHGMGGLANPPIYEP